MNLDLQRHRNSVEILFIYFILLQPALDVLAYFNIPISIILRVVVMGMGFIYILILPGDKERKIALIYIIMLGIFMVINFTNNLMVKNQFMMSLEITYIIKSVFFVELLIVYVFVIRSFSLKENWQRIIQLCIFINMVSIAAVMLLAGLSDTAKRSYGALAKEGHSGWFFSGNELSVILGMGFSMMVLYMINQKSRLKKARLLPFIGLVIWAMLTVGTKVSFGSIIIVLSISILVLIPKIVRNRKDWFNVITLSALLAATILITPSTSIGNNLSFSFGIDFTNQENRPSNMEEDHGSKGQLHQNLLSGRSYFLNNIKEQYREAPLSQKLFGMGVGGNYVVSPKLIEMDFLDWYFNFGLLGFVLLMLPLIYFGYHILFNIFSYHLKKINLAIVLVGLSVSLGLGSSMIAGHVLSSPASSIYLGIFIAYLYALTKQQRSSYIKK
ncbi:O-antigen ligase like membrane protein [Virgibacillus subterraneus]|uniref:O-antigen ligase like membrane protein n=1 Tax=Virgibacillus subterraneus TaxID=621109 RepID=A0A1H9AG27_9BACI|nr:O-antigen ligase family protein [Virgibacillus subterraneus]SEP74898.1 O-antigen ligase like membrane protein [Virgibacillus subterraneus]